MHPDAPGLAAVKDVELPCRRGRDLPPSTRDATVLVGCAPDTRMRMRTIVRTCFLLNSIFDSLLSSELLYQARCEVGRWRLYVEDSITYVITYNILYLISVFIFLGAQDFVRHVQQSQQPFGVSLRLTVA